MQCAGAAFLVSLMFGQAVGQSDRGRALRSVLSDPVVLASSDVGQPGAPVQSSPSVFPVPGRAPQAPLNQTPRTGTSRLRGRVVAADTGQPLRKAMVRLMSPEIRESRSTATNSDGAYEFKDLAAGRYTLSASKGSYVMLSYGQTRPFESGRPLAVGENQTLDKIDFRLPRGAVIAGRIVDEVGEPVADATVMAMRPQYMQGRRRLMPAGRSVMTDDIGEFRLFGLAPGQYYLSVSYRGGLTGQGETKTIDLRLAERR